MGWQSVVYNIDMIRDEIAGAIFEAVKLAGDDFTQKQEIKLSTPEVNEHGDYSCNIAMQVFGKLKNTNIKTPKELAENIKDNLSKDNKLSKTISKIEVAGPGFINFWLKEEYLLENLNNIKEEKDKYGSSTIGKGKTVVIDYSAPNIAKRFSVGHLRSTVIGQAIYNLYKKLGYTVIGDNHLGDWGTQFGILLHQISENDIQKEDFDIEKLEELYVEFNKQAEKTPELKEKAREWFKKLEDGDKVARDIWKRTIEVSMKEFDRIYERLGVKIDVAFGESHYEGVMPDILSEATKKGVVKKSQGAQIVEFDDMPPAIMLKSDGGTTYLTRDIATVKFRIEKWNPSIIIYEVGAEQTLHFRQVFETVRKLGWAKDVEFKHVPHGLFLFEGKKMSTRKGTNIKLEELLDRAVNKAKKLGSEGSKSAEIVGIGAVKYFDLLHSPTSNINFKWDEALSLQGNSGPYVQYAYARTQSVLVKASNSKPRDADKKIKLLPSAHSLVPEELAILRSLAQFPGVVMDAAKNYSPNLLCNYLFDLAQKYNTFYAKHKIVGSKNQETRIKITSSTGQVLKNGLTLLGIKSPERM